MRRTVISKVAAVVAVAAGAVGALALPAGADVSALSPPIIAGVQVGSPASLGARGAVVTVPVTVLCVSGGTADLALEVTEAVGGRVARGFGNAGPIACNGTFQTVQVTVPSSTVPFRRGPAFAAGSLSVCELTGCLSARDQREIRIAR
jgi:hypothetical protein